MYFDYHYFAHNQSIIIYFVSFLALDSSIITVIIVHICPPGETVDQTQVDVCQEDFTSALHSLVPSVSEQEINHYKSLQHFFTTQK